MIAEAAMKGAAAGAGRGSASPARKAADAAPQGDEGGGEEFVVGALDERIPQRMKKRRPEDCGQDSPGRAARILS